MAVSYKAPVKDVIFAFDVLDSYNILQKIERFSDFSPEIAVPAIEAVSYTHLTLPTTVRV